MAALFVLHWWCLQGEAVQLWGRHPAERGEGIWLQPLKEAAWREQLTRHMKSSSVAVMAG